MFINCRFCQDGTVERFFLEQATGKTRFALLPCPRCDGSSDMEQGIRRGEVSISEEEFDRRRSIAFKEAA